MKMESLLGAALIAVSLFGIAALIGGAAFCDFEPSVNLAEAAKETASPCLREIYRALR